MTRLLLLAALACSLAACGRAGPPIKPSEAAAKRAAQNGETAPPAPTPNAQNPDKPFILDGLL